MYEENEFEELAPWLAIIITVLGGFLRVLLLGAKGMWLDETFSVWLANHNLPELLQWTIRIDQHPPLYYLVLHYWINANGDTPYYARLLSALFGTATIPIIYLTGKRISGAMVGLAAAVFLAFSPFNIYYAQETRMYTLLAFNAALAIYALVRLLTDARSAMPIGSQFRQYLHTWRSAAPLEPDAPADSFSYQVEPPQTGWRAWVYRHRLPPIHTIETDLAWAAFIVFSAATLYTHNTAVFFLLAANLFVFGLILFQSIKKPGPQPAFHAPLHAPFHAPFRAPSLASWVKAQLGILLLWSPWIPVFLRQAGRVDQEFWIPIPTWDSIGQMLRSLLNASAPGLASQEIITWMLCGVLGLGLLYYRKKLSIFFFLAALFVAPVLGELLVSLRRPIFFDRTLIWITIPLFLLLAAGIAQLRFRPLMALALGIFATNYLFSTGDYLRFYQKEDWYTAAGYVAKFVEKDDLILFNSNFVVIPFDYYFKTREERRSLQVEKRGVPLDLFDSGVLEPRMAADDIPGLISLLSGRHRVWLVYSHESYTDPLGLIPQTLAAHKKLIRSREFIGGRIELYGDP